MERVQEANLCAPPHRDRIGLRNKIEHRFLPELDPDIFGECQAMLINFEALLSEEFGPKQAVGADFPFALQFSRITQPNQQKAMRTATRAQLKSVRDFVEQFRSSLSDDVSGDQAYSYKVFLIPKVGTHAKSSDVAIEFVKYDSTKPEEMKQYERLVAMIKPKQVSVANFGGLKASEVVRQVAVGIAKKFTLNTHVKCWKHYNTRPAGKAPSPELCDNRYCYYDAVHKDYIYTSGWVDFLVDKLGDPATYDLIVHGISPAPAAP